MYNSPIKAAVIGAGMIAREAHIPALLAQPHLVQVAALVGRTRHKVDELADSFFIPGRYTEVETMLLEVKPQLVIICTPNTTHQKYIRLALEHGAHVLCEKPLALTYQATLELFDLAKHQGLVLCACQTVRFTGEYQAAYDLVQSGQVGQAHFAEFSAIRRRGIPKWGHFHRRADSGGGCLADIGVHLIDAAVWLLKQPQFLSVSCTTASQFGKIEADLITSQEEAGAFAGTTNPGTYVPEEFDVEDFAAGSVRFANGLMLNFKVSWAVNLAPGFSLSLAGDKGGISLPGPVLYANVGRYQSEIRPQVFPEGPFVQQAFPGHFHLMENLLGYLVLGEELLIKPQETLTTAAIIEAAYLSAREGREVLAREITG